MQSRPATLAPQQPQPLPAQNTLVYDPAVRHPVFFTESLRKAPGLAGAGEGVGGVWSPVAVGYVWAMGPEAGAGAGSAGGEGGSKL